MDSKKQLKADITAKVYSKKISTANAQKLLGKSKRTIERYLQAYQKEGIRFVIHKNTNRSPKNKISPKLKKRVQNLIQKKYFDFNLSHLKEKLETDENIIVQRETLRSWAHEIHHVKRKKRRRPKARKRRDRMPSEGLMIQMDGSHHQWFGNKQSCLIAAIDDANSEIHAEFFDSETTLGCMKVLKQLIMKKGAFKTLYVDRAGIFGGSKRCNFSQVQRACKELGIEVIFARSAEAKGRIERAFNTLQDRLVAELRLRKIKDMKKANEYLQRKFIPFYWNKNISVKAESAKSEYTKLPPKKVQQALSFKEYRKIKKDHTFSYKGLGFCITSKLKSSLAGFEIELRTDLEGQLQCYFSGRKIEVKKIKMPSRLSHSELEAKNRIKAVRLATKLSSVTEASKQTGVSRQKIYRTKEILEEKGQGYFLKTFQKGSYCKNQKMQEKQSLVVNFSLENPHLGEGQVAKHLQNKLGMEISAGTVRGIWLRNNMQTIALRVEKAKKAA